MATILRFEELEVWKLGWKLYNSISIMVKRLRERKEYRFAEQMKSSSGSIIDNIAEGFERDSRLEFINALSISKGEAGELKSQLYRCLDDQHIDLQEFEEFYRDTDIVSKKIASFIVYLNGASYKGQKFKNRS